MNGIDGLSNMYTKDGCNLYHTVPALKNLKIML
jgi:hypothetical protein